MSEWTRNKRKISKDMEKEDNFRQRKYYVKKHWGKISIIHFMKCACFEITETQYMCQSIREVGADWVSHLLWGSQAGTWGPLLEQERYEMNLEHCCSATKWGSAQKRGRKIPTMMGICQRDRGVYWKNSEGPKWEQFKEQNKETELEYNSKYKTNIHESIMR